MSQRRFPVGAEVVGREGTHFRVWAPDRKDVSVVLDGGETVALTAEAGGYWAGLAPGVGPGARYRIKLDADGPFPDPVSRFQPDGPHGPSEVVDGAAFPWTDGGWKGVSIAGQVVYEMHVGTFTTEGTWAAAARELPELAACGITCLEVMPVAEFPGRFGWGYDGVNQFAPTRLYGTPDDFRRFVDAAHKVGLAVILDVVYNHFGPDGNYLKPFAAAYFTDKYKTEWGEAINFDGPDNAPVREFFVTNAAYWTSEFHLDGLRLDATQAIFDDTKDPTKHILADIGRAVRAAANGRETVIVAENEPQHPLIVRPLEAGGYGLDGLWNDDFHHAAMVAMTGRNEAYYTDYYGSPQEFVSALKYGYLYQGQYFSWQEKRRGKPGLDLPPAAFVTFTQNHDQIANSGRGLRAHQLSSPGRYKAATALTLLGPGTPMLFQGQEFAASAPFFYFADHNPDLAKLVQAGRVEFLQQFRSLADPAMKGVFADPEAAATFERCKLDFADRERNAPLYAMTKDLLELRKSALRCSGAEAQTPGGVDGAVLGPDAFLLRYFREDGADRLIIVNFGRDLHLRVCPEPLMAPPEGMRWKVVFSTENPKYGGTGTPAYETADEGWRIAGEAAAVFVPEAVGGESPEPKPGRLGSGTRRIVY